jgi:GlcNAc-P-P-Und epimerase
MKSKNIAVIGGSGFLGSYLIPILEKDNNIINFDIKNNDSLPCETIICDVRDKRIKNYLKGIDIVVLLAAEHLDNVKPTDLYYSVNVDGISNILAVINELEISKLIFTSSVAVYGFDQKNIDENGPLEPYNHYGISKLKSEEKINDYIRSNPDFECDIIRPTVIFGIGNRGNVYTLFNMISKGYFFSIGRGENVKSLCYVENVAAFISYLTNNSSNGKRIFNYVDYDNLNLNQTVDQIATILKVRVRKFTLNFNLAYLLGFGLDLVSIITGIKFKLSRIRVKKYCANSMFLADRAFQEFNPPYTLVEGLKKTLKNEFLLGKNNLMP